MMNSTTAHFITTIKPSTPRILVVGATTDERLKELGCLLREACPSATLDLYRPRREQAAPAVYDRIIQLETAAVDPEQLRRAGRYDLVVLAIAHVMHAHYKALVAACCACANDVFLYSAHGLQPLDQRDAQSIFPVPPKHAPVPPAPAPPRCWLFFRPSDQTVIQRADALERSGAEVFRVQTLAAFERLIGRVDAVFYDWCITDYGVLAAALEMAVEAGVRQEVFLALDLADLAEDPAMRERLLAFNRAVMPLFHQVYPLWTRPFLVERYRLSDGSFTYTRNIPNPDIWRRNECAGGPVARPGPLRFAYHGLFYFWHEVFEFMPVFQKIQEKCDAVFDLFGRVHDSVDVGGESLFPETERRVQAAFAECATRPGVCVHGFTAPDDVRKHLLGCDYYVGITQGGSLMSDTEMRTGVEEALALGCAVLHKPTSALALAGFSRNLPYFDLCRDKGHDIRILVKPPTPED